MSADKPVGTNALPGQLNALAAGIAHNQVVAWLHYLDDNVADEALGNELAAYLLDRAKLNSRAL